MLSKVQKSGFSYAAKFVLVDYSSENFQQLLKGRAWKDSPSADSLYRERQAFISEHYTLLPETLPQRVYELVGKITKDAGTDYDRLKAIESYLNQFDYTRFPDTIPEGSDVADYFLFESRKGYCTYFATAMAVLARCEGIPARYVEGLISNGSYHYDHIPLNLSGNNAHSWVEAYIPYIGWVPFEPTPVYTQAANTSWRVTDQEDAFPVSASEDASSHLQPQEPPLNSNQKISFPLIENREKVLKIAFQLLLYILLILCAVLFLMMLRHIIKRRIYIKSPAYAKLQYSMEYILGIGSLYGFSLNGGVNILFLPYAPYIKASVSAVKIRIGKKYKYWRHMHSLCAASIKKTAAG